MWAECRLGSKEAITALAEMPEIDDIEFILKFYNKFRFPPRVPYSNEKKTQYPNSTFN